MLTFDFETEGIVGNPIYNPPRPVGVAIKRNDGRSKYWAWGHPTNNNCTWEEGKAALMSALREDPEWLAHNRAFEEAVLRKWFNVRKKNTRQFHDTQFIVFLLDPYAFTYSLKPSAERYLDWAPDEQEELRDWVLSHVPEATKSTWGAFISRAPGDLVGKYACGDTDRTYGLYEYGFPRIVESGQDAAYRRELDLCPVLAESSLQGVPIARKLLAEELGIYRGAQKVAQDYIFEKLGEFELSKDAQLADALDRAGMITEWVLTPTGKRSTARKNLVGRVKDPELLRYLAYYGVTETCLGTFAEPWLAQSAADGRLHAQWNQVRGERGGDGDITGTRTGRLSCKEPNLTNIPNDFDGLVIPGRVEEYFRQYQCPHVPHMRRYMLPEVGHVWLKRDFSAQEMRILAHFAEGKLYEAYKRDPTVDPHRMVQEMLKELLGIDLPRKLLKIIAFGIMYGRGVPNLSLALGVSLEEGKRFRDAYFAVLPEVRELSLATRRRGGRGGSITTWGGRRYYREPNPDRDLSYKLLNYLIQGSAADQTKQSLVDWRAARGTSTLLAAVHDEINISAPVEDLAVEMGILQRSMDADRFDVPFRSEGFMGPNWSDIEEYADLA